MPEDGRGPVQEVGGEVEHDGELGELLQELPRGQGRVVGSPAPDQQEPPATLLGERNGMSISHAHFRFVSLYASEASVDRLRTGIFKIQMLHYFRRRGNQFRRNCMIK